MYICNIYILFESFDQDVFVVTSIFISYKSYKFKFENGTMLFVSFFFHHLLKSDVPYHSYFYYHWITIIIIALLAIISG